MVTDDRPGTQGPGGRLGHFGIGFSPRCTRFRNLAPEALPENRRWSCSISGACGVFGIVARGHHDRVRECDVHMAELDVGMFHDGDLACVDH